MTDHPHAQAFWGRIDLAAEALGGQALWATDEFFAACENLLKPGRGVFKPEVYTERGKWMDGWESRRKRVPGHDVCIIRLGIPGHIDGVDIDTNHFLGNHPPFASVDACHAPEASLEDLRTRVSWAEVVPQLALQRGSQNLATAIGDAVYTHVRLRIFPAGGVARFRVYGRPAPQRVDGRMDLAALVHGGRALACSDMFFSPMNNLLLPFEATDMGGGWESRRSRPPGSDWVIVQLGTPGRIDEFDVDTSFFKGNYPDRCAVDAVHWPDAPPHALVRSTDWQEIVPSTKLGRDRSHRLPATNAGPWTHVRLRIVPDGGVSRLRVWGEADDSLPGAADSLVSALNDLDVASAHAALIRCCGSRRWADQMITSRPFTSRTHLFGVAEQRWWALDEQDWREAFDHHPTIGGNLDTLREKYAATADWSASEQAGMADADESTLQGLAQGNQEYEDTFGHLFLVCASGKTAPEMLALLQERMDNEPTAELRIAAGEQAKITRLRLEKLGLGP